MLKNKINTQQICLFRKKTIPLHGKFQNITIMIDNPSYNGIGSYSRTVLRTTRKEAEDRVTTQRSTPSTPSPRGHA